MLFTESSAEATVELSCRASSVIVPYVRSASHVVWADEEAVIEFGDGALICLIGEGLIGEGLMSVGLIGAACEMANFGVEGVLVRLVGLGIGLLFRLFVW